MSFCFYPKHEYACPHVNHCPHLGGAALGTLVHAADDHEQYIAMILGQLDFERGRNAKLFQENQQLQAQVEQLKLELKVERQSKFATSASEEPEEAPLPPPSREGTEKKRGAPVGHPGWFRPTPTHYDRLIEAAAPERCPHCDGDVRCFPQAEPDEHWQEDVVDGRYQVVLYRHSAARCGKCRRWVKQAAEGELLGSRIGPRLRTWALYLRSGIGISSRKIPKALEELLGVTFTPAALLAFERMLAERAAPLAEDIAKKIASSDGAVHADETYWTVDGERAFYWVHGDENYLHFQFNASRAGEVSRDLLGPYFDGTLVTDCYAGYEAHAAKAKQKCLAHLARTARDWQKVTPPESAAYAFFDDVKAWVQRGCRFHCRRARGELSPTELTQEAAWLREELLRLQTCPVDHEKALTLQGRIRKHAPEWLVFVDDPRVPPTNNLAERALRPLVVLRKITFGHRTQAGARRMAKLMTVQETGRRHGHRPTKIFYGLFTRPPNDVLRDLYAKPR